MSVTKMQLFKVEVFLPRESLEDIRSAIYSLGLGKIGNYDCCLSWYETMGSWRPLGEAKPYLGTLGEIEVAPEYKLEFKCEEKDLKRAIDVIKAKHPYEEVGINIIPLYELQ